MNKFNFLKVLLLGSLIVFYSCERDEESIDNSFQQSKNMFDELKEVNTDDLDNSEMHYHYEVDTEISESKSSRTTEYYDYFIINQSETTWFYANSDQLDSFWGFYVDVKIKHGGYDFNAYSYPSNSYIWFGEAFYRHFRYNIGGNGVAVTGMLAHEYAHQVQWRLGIGNYNYTLYNELQADALAGYFMGHQSGENLGWSQVQYVAEGQGSVAGGDHGTYQQRYNAVKLGYDIAKQYPNISSQEFKRKFDNWFY